MNVAMTDEWGGTHIVVDAGGRALFIDTTSGFGKTPSGDKAYVKLRILVAPGTVEDKHDGSFLLGAKEVQQLHEMCSAIMAKLAAEALK